MDWRGVSFPTHAVSQVHILRYIHPYSQLCLLFLSRIDYFIPHASASSVAIPWGFSWYLVPPFPCSRPSWDSGQVRVMIRQWLESDHLRSVLSFVRTCLCGIGTRAAAVTTTHFYISSDAHTMVLSVASWLGLGTVGVSLAVQEHTYHAAGHIRCAAAGAS